MGQTLDYEANALPELKPRRPLMELLWLAGPTVAQMASYTLMQFVDTWMLSHSAAGIDGATAASNSGILAFSVISLGMGVLWVVNTLVSQNFGQRDFRTCGRYLWQGIWFSLSFSLLLVPVLPFVSPMFRWFGHESRLVQYETTYFQIVVAASLLKLVGTTFGQFLLAVNRSMDVFFATVCGVGVNAVAAWMLVFGAPYLGIRPMGISGAAWAQNIGVAVETSVLIYLAMRPHVRVVFNALDWRPRWAEMRNLVRIGVPSGLQIISDVLAWALFINAVMGVFSSHVMAANTFMMRFMSVSFMPAFGISTAVTALVGRYIGMGKPEVAIRRANLGFAVTAAYMLTCGLGFYLGRHFLIGLFTQDPDVLRVGAMLLVFAAVYQTFDAMYIIYNGALRGAGDTLVPAVATFVLCWGITVGIGMAVARAWPQFGAAGPWTVATIYGIILGVFMYARFRRGKWRCIALEDDSPSKNLPAQPAANQ